MTLGLQELPCVGDYPLAVSYRAYVCVVCPRLVTSD